MSYQSTTALYFKKSIFLSTINSVSLMVMLNGSNG